MWLQVVYPLEGRVVTRVGCSLGDAAVAHALRPSLLWADGGGSGGLCQWVDGEPPNHIELNGTRMWTRHCRIKSQVRCERRER